MARSSGAVLERSLTTEVMYGRSSDHLRVFVSSKMRDGSLAAERQTAVRVIDSHPWHKAWTWESSAQAGPYSARRVCIANAETSDALVLIVADDLTSITKSEYFAAKKQGVPRFILAKADVVRSPDLEQFLKRERSKSVTVNYRNLPEFRSRIRGALREFGIRSHRAEILRERAGGR